MISARRLITRSILGTTSPEAAQARQNELESIDNRVHRAGALALHSIVINHPTFFASLIGSDYRPNVMPVVGTGYWSVVLRKNESEVLKINQKSLLMSVGEQEELAERKQREHEIMAEHLGEFVLPQTTSVESHPCFPGLTAVQITQPYRKIYDPGLVDSRSTEQSVVQAFAGLHQKQHHLLPQLESFVELSHSLAARPEELLPDTYGDCNLVLDRTNGNLLMIDGQPTGPDEPDIQREIRLRLDYLGSALQVA